MRTRVLNNDYSKKNDIIIHVTVIGKVQGVGFRRTTQYEAKKLGISGTVSNLPNGNVEIFAKGTNASIQALIQTLNERFSIEKMHFATNPDVLHQNDQDFLII